MTSFATDPSAPPPPPGPTPRPPADVRGLMWDMARLTERFDTYMKLPGLAAEMGYSSIFAHLCDDEGCAIRFESHPELACPHALTHDQLRAWIDHAAAHGQVVVPEIECFGHTGYIHRKPGYAHLGFPGADELNAIDPTHPQTRRILGDLIAETASLFDSDWLHVGFDEVDPGTGYRLHRPDPAASWDDLFIEHLHFVDQEVRRHGKRTLIWADHLLANPALADRVSRDVLLCDWQYGARVNGTTTRTLQAAGFEVLACPASSRATEVVTPGRTTLDNLQQTARFARRHAPGVGLVNTYWCPQRMLMGVAEFAVFLGGRWFQNPDAPESDLASVYARHWHGLPAIAADAAGRALLDLADLTLTRSEFHDLLRPRHPDTAPAHSADELPPLQDRLADVLDCGERLRRHRSSVTRHRETYDAFILAADLIAWTLRVGIAHHHSSDPHAPRLAEAGDDLLRRCGENWETRCHHDDDKRFREVLPGRESILPTVREACRHLAR